MGFVSKGEWNVGLSGERRERMRGLKKSVGGEKGELLAAGRNRKKERKNMGEEEERFLE